MGFKSQREWTAWLKRNYAKSAGIWMRFAKKGSGLESVTYQEALESALCYGWIDSQVRSENVQTYLQKFTPRRAKSIWSKINRDKALRLIENGLMHPAGLAEVERAKADGRWDAAYDSWGNAVVPPDLEEALRSKPKARKFFETLDGRNRYAILFRIHSAKRAETRAKRVRDMVAMLGRAEKLYP